MDVKAPKMVDGYIAIVNEIWNGEDKTASYQRRFENFVEAYDWSFELVRNALNNGAKSVQCFIKTMETYRSGV